MTYSLCSQCQTSLRAMEENKAKQAAAASEGKMRIAPFQAGTRPSSGAIPPRVSAPTVELPLPTLELTESRNLTG